MKSASSDPRFTFYPTRFRYVLQSPSDKSPAEILERLKQAPLKSENQKTAIVYDGGTWGNNDTQSQKRGFGL